MLYIVSKRLHLHLYLKITLKNMVTFLWRFLSWNRAFIASVMPSEDFQTTKAIGKWRHWEPWHATFRWKANQREPKPNVLLVSVLVFFPTESNVLWFLAVPFSKVVWKSSDGVTVALKPPFHTNYNCYMKINICTDKN